MRIRPVTSTVSGGTGDMGSRSLSMRMVASRESRSTRDEADIFDVIFCLYFMGVFSGMDGCWG